jgi:hypothetical protein
MATLSSTTHCTATELVPWFAGYKRWLTGQGSELGQSLGSWTTTSAKYRQSFTPSIHNHTTKRGNTMSYGPKVLETLSRQYTLLHDTLSHKGVNLWYGEAGNDLEVVKMLIDNKPYAEIQQYLIDNYGEEEEEE